MTMQNWYRHLFTHLVNVLSLLHLDICFLFSGLSRKISFILGTQNSTVNSDSPNAFYRFSDPNEICYSALFVLTVFRACFVFFMKYLQSAIHFPLTQQATRGKKKKKKVILFLFVYLFLIQNLLYYTCQGRFFWVLWAVTRYPVLVISTQKCYTEISTQNAIACYAMGIV